MNKIMFLILSSGILVSQLCLAQPRTDAEKLADLLEIKKQIPALFSDAAKYDIDLFTLLEDQADLVKELEKLPKFKELSSQRRYFDLTVTPPKEGITVGATEIRPEAVQAWKQGLVNLVAKLSTEETSTPQKLLSQIQDLKYRVRFKEDPSTQLKTIGRVPESRDKKAFQSQVDALKAKNTLLYQCYRGESLLSKFQCLHTQYKGLEGLPHLPSKIELGQTISTLIAEEKLHSLLNAYIALTQNPEGSLPKTWEGAQERINKLSVDDLIHLDDKNEALKPWIEMTLGNSEETALERERSIEAPQ